MGLFKRKEKSSQLSQTPMPQSGLRSVAQLMVVDDPAWDEIMFMVEENPERIGVLPVTQVAGERTLHRLQVTVRSYMGAVVRYSGGMLIDDGWIRLLGGGSAGLPNMASASGFPEVATPGTFVDSILVGHDVMGGMFRVTGVGPAAGHVLYFAPDTLEWQDLEVGYSQFVGMLLTGGLDTTKFYEGMRWSTWREDTQRLELNQGFSIYPPLFTQESKPIESTSRKPVPIDELFVFNESAAKQLGKLTGGSNFTISV